MSQTSTSKWVVAAVAAGAVGAVAALTWYRRQESQDKAAQKAEELAQEM